MILSINIPDVVAPQIIDDICTATNFDAASGKNKAAWAKDQIIRTIKNLATSGAVKTAMATSKAALDGAAIN